MDFIRRSVKAFMLAVCVFVLLTLILAALLRFTGCDEDWTIAGLVAALSLAALLLGFLEGNIVGRRGLTVGTAAAAVFLIIIFPAVGGVFAGTSEEYGFHWLHLVPILSGAAGGVLGANSRKS